VVEPRLAPAPAPQTSSSESGRLSAAAPDAAPTIRVHIGRIDVRAVMPPAQQESRRAPARPRPSLTLEDYLGRRSGGPR
jgi:hypothetical protein